MKFFGDVRNDPSRQRRKDANAILRVVEEAFRIKKDSGKSKGLKERVVREPRSWRVL